ncbi:MAG TPA: helix-turn-helix transcriptional regulator [Pyrinomonadaceae bacterium]
MAASFGEQLRLAREARGITLRHISDQTRISIRYLEAIEADDYKRLPGGIFNRSFIKAYAKQIGFDEKEAVEGYLRTAREQGEPEEVATTPYSSHVYTDGGSRSPLITLLLTILILAVLSLGVYAAVHWYQRREAAKEQNGQQPTNGHNPQQTVNNGAQPNVSPTPNVPANAFHIEVSALNKDVWVEARIDDEKKGTGMILKQGDPPKLFDPAQRLTIKYAQVNANALKVTINNRPAVIPTDKAEMVIAKEDYQRLLQQ